jgi:glycosyltransferase involved in cell wall biosynthesis
MKIAILHPFFDVIGGAEVLVLTLAKELDATIYTTNIDYTKIKKMGFDDVNIKSLGRVPNNPPFRHLLVLAKFRRLNFKNKFDNYIITGDWAISGAVNNKPNLWYIHSPNREIWDLNQDVRLGFNVIKRFLFDIWVKYYRHLNKKYIKHIKLLVSNSKNTQRRVKMYLKRNSTIINPPTETSKYFNNKPKNYWLSVNRLSWTKRVEIQLKAFATLPNEKLIIVGSFENSKHNIAYANHCKKTKPENVEIVSNVEFKKLLELYANCKGFITTAKDEDFGMTPVEAMASGKPVIAGNEGGYKETVIHAKTGILIDDINSDKLAEEIKKMSEGLKANPNKYKTNCINRAKEFDTKEFIKKMKKTIKK